MSRSRVRARARSRPDNGGDPLDGLVNLFDLGVVLAVAFLLAALASLDLTDVLTRGEVTVVRSGPDGPDDHRQARREAAAPAPRARRARRGPGHAASAASTGCRTAGSSTPTGPLMEFLWDGLRQAVELLAQRRPRGLRDRRRDAAPGAVVDAARARGRAPVRPGARARPASAAAAARAGARQRRHGAAAGRRRARRRAAALPRRAARRAEPALHAQRRDPRPDAARAADRRRADGVGRAGAARRADRAGARVRRLARRRSPRSPLREARIGILAATIAAAGSAFAEVGAVVLVGGNIDGQTQTLASAVLVRVSAGEYGTAIALGAILLRPDPAPRRRAHRRCSSAGPGRCSAARRERRRCSRRAASPPRAPGPSSCATSTSRCAAATCSPCSAPTARASRRCWPRWPG